MQPSLMVNESFHNQGLKNGTPKQNFPQWTHLGLLSISHQKKRGPGIGVAEIGEAVFFTLFHNL